ncbi:pyrroloquinoline quinone biosynthesis peptide chaperone PqqD [Methylogaea oryzae]|uniref:Coenzyme PQQ synthesis protein D n=1 Tax=Methylogaea oryzae TaxID=1295382 RepID=A0A8D4VP40_9GAMM|nr:pyrroloquinoline quinone biosynthesis peptide chaperone PqqD [Methylogaea oryzae]BBL70092.1 coenzyme PQQ synthesis protein D [Methylogaea oryzae]
MNDNTLRADAALRFSPLHRLQWEEAQQKYVILYPEGMVELNPSAAEILKLCDGRNLDDLVATLEAQFDTTGLKGDVSEFLEVALANGWIQQNHD